MFQLYPTPIAFLSNTTLKNQSVSISFKGNTRRGSVKIEDILVNHVSKDDERKSITKEEYFLY